MYKSFMNEYELLGHMSLCDTTNKDAYFIPHHGVMPECSTTIKLRVVFNASSPTNTGVSFNNLQMIGPVVQDDIPRLELCGDLVGVRIYEKVVASLRVRAARTFFWSDSMIVLGWLKMLPNKLQPFVRNRIAEILDKTPKYTLLINKKELPKKSPLNKFKVFLDDQNIMHVGGRLQNSNYQYDKKHPILLRSNHDLTPLTPGHFLFGRPLVSLPSPNYEHRPVNSLTRFQRIEQLRQHFWTRWSKEYISELQIRTKWRSCKGSLKLNSLVLLKEDNLPPLKWGMGRIVAVHPGPDGIIRVADVKTSNGVVRRSFSKICPLPHLSEDGNSG
ncbi:uncharacterized protein LOC126779429 [Nymphalis io]|uniref:uncharacterized protein LOC126779429 n=1 Tax=Inachis io TaxID=171585 RepID=UPI002169E53D|nr:uncharacterized protein LOC126779429 [Nymphalis io]